MTKIVTAQLKLRPFKTRILNLFGKFKTPRLNLSVNNAAAEAPNS